MGQLLWKDSNIVTSPHECQCHLQYITFSARASGEENVLSSSTKNICEQGCTIAFQRGYEDGDELTLWLALWSYASTQYFIHMRVMTDDYMNIKKKSHARSASIKNTLGDHQNRIGSATMSLYFCSPFGRHFNLQQHYLTQASHAFGVSSCRALCDFEWARSHQNVYSTTVMPLGFCGLLVGLIAANLIIVCAWDYCIVNKMFRKFGSKVANDSSKV